MITPNGGRFKLGKTGAWVRIASSVPFGRGLLKGNWLFTTETLEAMRIQG